MTVYKRDHLPLRENSMTENAEINPGEQRL
jgi:hypothetical protein